MNIDSYGIILNVENFDECVAFYKNVFNLSEMFTKEEGDFKLACLAFGESYLMLETGGVASISEKVAYQNPTALRFNVSDIHEALAFINKYDSQARILESKWGAIIRVMDPDGNPISIRDQAGFLKQVNV